MKISEGRILLLCLPFFPVVWKRAAVYDGQGVHVLNQAPILDSFILVNVPNSAIVTIPNAEQKLNYFCVSPPRRLPW